MRHTPMACLSRAVSGLRGRTLITNLPGSARAVKESLPLLRTVLPHALDILRADVTDCAKSCEIPASPESGAQRTYRRAVSRRTATNSATMLTAISSTVFDPISIPIGARNPRDIRLVRTRGPAAAAGSPRSCACCPSCRRIRPASAARARRPPRPARARA